MMSGRLSIIRMTKFTATYFIICLCTLFFGIATAQQGNYSISSLGINEGLSQSTVFSILQDRKGFLWFGTRTGGLNKYDGNSFTYYKKDLSNPNGISGNEILTLVEDSRGIIWVGTRNDGISRFDPEKEKFYQYHHSADIETTISNNSVQGICEDSNGIIWLATNSGVCRYNPSTDSFIRVNNSITNESFGQALKIIKAEDFVLIATRDSGLYIVDANTDQVVSYFQQDDDDSTSINTNYIYTLLYDSQGRVWAGTRNNGVNLLNNLESTSFIHFVSNPDNPESISSNIIRTLHEDKNGNIWVGTKSGLDMLEESTSFSSNQAFTHYKNDPANKNSISQNSIYSFEEDIDGNFWVGTWSGGVNYMNKGGYKFELYRNNDGQDTGLSNNVVSSFASTNAGLWIGTEGGGLNLYNESDKTFRQFRQDKDDPNSLQSDHIKSLYVDHAGDLWVGTFNGLHLFSSEQETFQHFLQGKSIYSIEGGEHGEIWIGSSGGLFLLSTDDFEIKEYVVESENSNSISNNAVNKLFRDSQGRLWVGTKVGLNLYSSESDSFTRFFNSRTDINSISNSFITTINEGADSTIWVGTVDGLNQFVEGEGTFLHFGEKNCLPDNVINNILGDDDGSLWLTTNKGLAHFYPENDPDVEKVDYVGNAVGVKNYTVADGLQGNEFIVNASYKDAQNRFYFGGVDGFNSFDAKKLTSNNNIPRVVLTGLKLFNKEVIIGAENSPLERHISETKELLLNHEQSVFTFEFVAMNYESPEKNQYAYMMEGLDNDWISIRTRKEVSYTNLPAGEYVFRVVASNNDGKWNEEGTSLNLTILAPWWRTSWFLIPASLVVVILILIGIRWRLKKLKRDRNLLQEKLEDGRVEIEAQQQRVIKQEEELKLRDRNDKQMKWYNEGFIDLSNIISENRDDLKTLSEMFLSSLIKYLDAKMGAIYFLTENDEKQWLEAWATYAADHKRDQNKKVGIDEGLLGECFKNREPIRMDNLPDDYASLSSGLGEVPLRHLVIVPILFEDKAEGVLEIISLEKLEDYKIELINNISKHLAALITNKKEAMKNEEMLNAATNQKEEMSKKEEELRQILVELTATQEEANRREKQLHEEIANLKKVKPTS